MSTTSETKAKERGLPVRESGGPDARPPLRIRSLPDFVRAFGQWRFGRVPRVGDPFCGGGSIPFEAARLTWAALNIVGGGPEVARQVRAAQEQIYAAVERQVTAFLDEARRQLAALHDLDEEHPGEPDFGDTDYQLAAYAAALRVLTQYARLEDIDIARELVKPRVRVRGGEKSP